MVDVHGLLMCPPSLYCILFYTVIVAYKGVKTRSFLFSAEEVQRFRKIYLLCVFFMCFETHKLPIFSCYRLFQGCCHFVSWMWTLQHCIINSLGILTTPLWHILIHQFLQYPQSISFCLFCKPCVAWFRLDPAPLPARASMSLDQIDESGPDELEPLGRWDPHHGMLCCINSLSVTMYVLPVWSLHSFY